MVEVQLGNANLVGAVAVEANLDNAFLFNADVTHANFTDAFMKGVTMPDGSGCK